MSRSLLLLVALALQLQQPAFAETEPTATESSGNALQPLLTVIGELWHNTSGGVQTGSRWNSLAELGLDLDLSAQIHWVENQHTGADFGNLTGAANPSSSIMAADHLRVFNLFYRHSWAKESYVLKIGQLALDDDFMGSDYAGLFAHSALGALPSQVATPQRTATGGGSAFPIYVVAAPGVHFAARVTDRFSVQAGLYHGGPGPDERGNRGFDWDRGSGQGLVLFYEGAISFQLAGHAYTLRAGGALHTGRFDDFAAQADGAEARGLRSFYLIQDLILAAADAEHPKLAVFWRAGLSPQRDRSVVARYVDAELNWFAPLPGRADDLAGLALSHTEYGPHFRRLTGTVALAAAETAVELTYRAQITPAFAMQPVVQWHFNPAPDEHTGRRRTATVVGLRAELIF